MAFDLVSAHASKTNVSRSWLNQNHSERARSPARNIHETHVSLTHLSTRPFCALGSSSLSFAAITPSWLNPWFRRRLDQIDRIPIVDVTEPIPNTGTMINHQIVSQQDDLKASNGRGTPRWSGPQSTTHMRRHGSGFEYYRGVFARGGT